MPKLIAQWNPARDVWEEATMGLFCEHSDVYSATWPSSGMTQGGTAYELPTSAHLTAASVSSSLLPTPVADHSRGLAQPGSDYASLPNVALSLLPTPRASEAEHSGRTKADHSGQTGLAEECNGLALLPTPTVSEANGAGSHGTGGLDLRTTVSLLPTPAVNDMGEGKTVEHWDEWTATMQAKHGNGNGHGKSLAIEAQRLLPTPTTRDHKGANQRDDDTCLMGALIGASTRPPSPAGNASSDDPHPHLPSPDPRADSD